MKKVISFSGGGTSGKLVEIYKDDPDAIFIFMDTGAEHPDTYRFIRDVVKNYHIDLVCLRVLVSAEMGDGGSWVRVSIDDIGPDLEPWKQLMAKYGTPYFGGAFCSERMKGRPFKKYCDDTFGKRNYETILGIRYDEPKRVWGEKVNKFLIESGIDDTIRFYKECKGKFSEGGHDLLHNYITTSLLNSDEEAKQDFTQKACKRITTQVASNIVYMAEISDYEKPDVLKFWKKQGFGLQIPEHLGNCMFCIKKGLNKVALAAKDEPVFKSEFLSAITDDSVKVITTRKHDSLVMYRSSKTFEQVIQMFSDVSRDDLYAALRGKHTFDTGSCSESCEPLSLSGYSD